MATRMQQRRGTAAQWTAANPTLAAGEIGFETDTSKFKMGNGSSAWTALTYFANAAELLAIIDGAPAALNTLNELAAAIGDDPAFFTNIAESIADNVDSHNVSLNIHGIANTSLLATLANVATAKTEGETFTGTAITNHSNDTTQVHGIDDTSVLATATTVSTAVGTAVTNHNSDTTQVHGIDDTSVLATATTVSTAVGNAVTTHNSDTTEVHGIADTAALATKTYADTAVSTHQTDTTEVHGIANTADLATKSYADTAVSTHQSDTTSVHGITDTADLATKTYADTAVSTHQADTTDVHGISNTANLVYVADLTAHNSDTTDVHGIANTALLALLSDLTAHATDTTTIHGIADTSLLATQDFVTTTVGNSEVDQSALAGVGIDWNSVTEKFDIDSTVATTTHVSTEIGTHNSDTTSVHGIADTSLLATTADVAAVTKTSLGLGSVDNTADTAKPVSTSQASAIATAKAEAIADATSQVSALLTGAPAALNTLDELAAALGDDANFASSVTTSLGLKVDSLTPISQKTASYTLSSLTERDDLIEMGSASALVLTIPTDATLDFPIGTSIDILQTGAGQVTVAPVSGTVTVNATPGLKLRTTWSSATLFKRAANTWVVFGDLTA